MTDFEARRIIETLRSGVPSRAIGRIFSSARSVLLEQISEQLDDLSPHNNGMVLLGKYGEGKTHLLNSVFSLAQSKNMVVSIATLSKETPFDKLYLIYPKLIANTFLPGRPQPGFEALFEAIAPHDARMMELLLFAGKSLETDKLYYLLRAFLNIEEREGDEEKFALLADLEGDLMPVGTLKKIYRRIFAEPANFSAKFTKTKHMFDYFSFSSQLFRTMGYRGWVLLFDEAELIGQLGKKARINAYANMAKLLSPRLHGTYSLFAFGASFKADVIEEKHERENLESLQLPKVEHGEVERVIEIISTAPQLSTVTDEELLPVLEQIRRYHGQAYGWNPGIEAQTLLESSDVRKPLRTRIRLSIEMMDQLYQYGQTGKVKIGELMEPTYEEEEELPMPEVPEGR